MTDPQPLGPAPGERLLCRLQTLLLEADRLEDFLKELVTLAASELPVPAHCSITLGSEGRTKPYTAAASDELVDRFDQRQYAVGDGPCLATLRTGDPHHVENVDLEERFGDFPGIARESGLRSMLALPLVPPRQQLAGVMNLYSTEPGSFTRPVREEAAVFAGHVAGALGVALKIAGHLQFSLDLQHAIASRTVIDQALGILMSQERCGAERAFEFLSRASQNRNMKLRDLAADIVESVTGRPPSSRPPRPRRSRADDRPGAFRPTGEG
ncbi:GAF and ANTAR domain-containing protein [Streptomyces sp. S.PB5]|uniref:GAF and ANTAR domain-containing protein n=1 Tax=Streptomyces sp. S.PB5 TaxID=3020844 RepID=UPI0025B24C7C|nr:GAF and ANTAR domain-containing protein [Streptomyces sp. S.PB5]MDN3023572.1 GAF and ANTAR domain-containing protein [Streptomyces sp. S.PB5]